jgi:proton glutamate symport protein
LNNFTPIAAPRPPVAGTLYAALLPGLALYLGGFLLQIETPHHTAAIALRVCALLLLLAFTASRNALTAWTLFCMLAGAELGADTPAFATHTKILGDIFLRLIRVIAAPLIIGTLSTGIAGHGHLKRIGPLALKTLIYFEVITTLGLVLGAVAINLTKAGVGVVLPASIAAASQPVAAPRGWEQIVLNAFPENLALAVSGNQILQLAVFALLLGTAMAMLPEPKRAPLLTLLTSVTETMFQITRLVMYLAPLAAGAAIAYTVGSMGVATLIPLAKLVATYYGSLAVFTGGILIPIMLVARVPVRQFFAAASEPVAIGFATSASEAALPLALERMEQFGVPRWIVSFVIPTGYSFNMDGASIYLSIGAIFTAQAAGIHLSLGETAAMLLTLMLASKGIAGVPRATLVLLLAIASSLHLPTAPVFLILGVDALMDMGRTSMNVFGNCLASAVIAKWEDPLESPLAQSSFETPVA